MLVAQAASRTPISCWRDGKSLAPTKFKFQPLDVGLGNDLILLSRARCTRPPVVNLGSSLRHRVTTSLHGATIRLGGGYAHLALSVDYPNLDVPPRPQTALTIHAEKSRYLCLP